MRAAVGARPGTGAARPDRAVLAMAEVALTALTISAALGLGRALANWSFVPQLLATALIGHGLATACRRLGYGSVAAGALSAVAWVPVLTLVHLPGTTFLGLPTWDTLHVLVDELADGWRAFGNVKPPAPVLPGFVAASIIATWFVAFAADAAAFRARAVTESIVPASALFVFGAALNGHRARIPLTACFLAALLACWLTQRALERTSSLTWMSRDTSTRGAASLLRLGAALSVGCIVAAVLIGPNLPGADADPLIPWRASDRNHGSSRITVSPLVDIKSRIVDQADTEVFTVAADARSYWRLTALERFDGRIWSSNRSYGRARGTLGSDVDTRRLDEDAIVLRQDFQIGALASFWLPAANRPVHVDGVKARYDADSNSLLTDEETAAGAVYSVESHVPNLTAAELRSVAPVAPEAVVHTYLALPDDFSPDVERLALRVVAGARTQYDKARLLQDFFQSGRFTYDLNVPAGHGATALEDFLFRTQRGYCEQFSGAYAAMARAAGLPARVAVGFTAGELGADGLLHVRGRNGHAWPEVYFEGFGWVAFEPTPGRGIPGAQAYTALPERQADAGDAATATTLAPTTTTAAPAPGAPITRPIKDDPTTAARRSAGSTWLRRLVIVLALLLGLPTVWALAVTTITRRRRERRRRTATSANERVLVSWAEVGEALARVGAPPRPWETPAEFAQRAATSPADAGALRELALATTAAAYGSRSLPDEIADEAAAVAARIEGEVETSLDRRGRARLMFDPRPLLRERPTRFDVEERVTGRA